MSCLFDECLGHIVKSHKLVTTKEVYLMYTMLGGTLAKPSFFKKFNKYTGAVTRQTSIRIGNQYQSVRVYSVGIWG